MQDYQSNAEKEQEDMEVRGPEQFCSILFRDDYGFWPVNELVEVRDWPVADWLESVMGDRPVSIALLSGYGIYIPHEDFWVFGATPQEVRAVAEEWPQ